MAQAEDQQLLHAKHKAASCLFPYVVWQDRVGQREMLGALLHAAMTSNSERFMWRRIQPYITTLSNKPSPPSLDQVIVFASPHVSWHDGQHNENMVTRWGAAASAVPYTEEVGQSVVDALLQIASVDSLRPHIPIETWAWLRRRPSLLPECSGRSKGTDGDIVRQVRTLGDIEVLKSYLLLVWSEWDPISPRSGGLAEMHVAIRERFNGIGMGRHREDLIKRLDHVLGQLDWGLLEEHRSSLGEDDTQRAKEQYEELKKVLLEVDREAVNVLARTLPSLIPFAGSTDTHGHVQNPIQSSRALCLFHARSLFGTLDSYNGPYPVVAFPYTLPVGSERSKFLSTYARCPGVLNGPAGKLVVTLWVSRCH